MIPDLKLRIHFGLSFFSLSFCLVGLFIDSWGEGDSVQTQFEDVLVSREVLKDFEYKSFSEVGIFRSCLYNSCISNPADGGDIWKIIVGLGSLSLGCLTTTAILSGFQICSEAKWLIFGQLAFHLIGVILYTATIVLFCMETTGIVLGVGFFFAVFADVFSLCSWLGSLSSIKCAKNRVDQDTATQT